MWENFALEVRMFSAEERQLGQSRAAQRNAAQPLVEYQPYFLGISPFFLLGFLAARGSVTYESLYNT